MTTIETDITTTEDPLSAAGAAWEHAAEDWAHLFEPYARDAVEEVFKEIGVGNGTQLFDMACGSGLALGRAERLGAFTTGLDVSVGLIEIARRRAPNSELHVGTMFDLPFVENSFDAVSSFNGVWGGCGDAFHEAFRVVRPGGKFGVTFWGPGDRLGLRDFFIALGSSTPAVGEEMKDTANIGAPGVVEAMYESAGFVEVWRGATSAILEFPDSELAWRALRSPGLVLPALEAVGETELRNQLMPTIEKFRSGDGSYRIVNELTHATGTKPL